MGIFHRNINQKLADHIYELERFKFLPRDWSWHRGIVIALDTIDRNLIRDLMRLHRKHKDNPRTSSRLMPLLLYLHKDLEKSLKKPSKPVQDEEIQLLRELIEDLKELILNDRWSDERLINKIGSSELIYRKDEPVNLAMMRYFVLADRYKKALSEKLEMPKAWNYVLPLSREDFVRLYREVYQETAKFMPDEIFKLVYHPERIDKGSDPHRLWRFKNAKWSVRTINIKDMGVWPEYGGTDHFTTSGNLIDTARKIKMFIHGNIKEWPKTVKPTIPREVINSTYSIRHYGDIIYRLFPIVITKRGKIQEG